MTVKRIATIFFLSSTLIIYQAKASEFQFITSYKPEAKCKGPSLTMVDFCPLSFEILKRELKAKTVPVVQQLIKENMAEFQAQINDQAGDGRAYEMSILLTIVSTFNKNMNDILAQKICSFVAQKEAKPDFRAEQTVEITDDCETMFFSQRTIDLYTNYKHENIQDVPSIICTTTITDQYFLYEAIKAVQKE